jgi:hypothetical protein
MPRELIHLPIRTSQTVTGPRYKGDKNSVVVEYDYERDDGSREWCSVVFEEVLLVEFRQDACCEEGDILSSDEVVTLDESPRLRETVSRWQESVGWQEWHQNQGGGSRFRHFKMYFDDAGCLDVIAASCTVKPGESP